MGIHFGCGDNSCMFGAPSGLGMNGGCQCLEALHYNAADRETARRIRAGVAVLRTTAAHAPALADALRAVLGVYGPHQSAMPREGALIRALKALAAYDAAKGGK